MNLRALMDWGLVYKDYKSGERREFFYAEKDLDEMAVKIAKERSKREIKPTLKVLKEISSIEKENEEATFFVNQTTDLYQFILKADNLLEKITVYNDNWLAKLMLKLMK
jgi:DNA-binding transcriptional regulator GbsR (MarR family)